jgi:hypothetical protein
MASSALLGTLFISDCDIRPHAATVDLNIYASLAKSANPSVGPLQDSTSVPPGIILPTLSPPDYPLLPPPTESLSTDCLTTEGEDENLESCVSTPLWENFSDLEFPRENLTFIETLGNGIFGEVSWMM